MKKIVIVVSDESYRLLQNHPDRPRQRWGRQNVPEFYAAVLQMGMDSDQFKLREAEARNRSLALTVQWQEAKIRRLEHQLRGGGGNKVAA